MTSKARFLLPLVPLVLAACKSGDEPRLVARTADLAHTKLVSGPGHPLEPDQNLFWCASLALAWEELEALIGGPVRTARPSTELALLQVPVFKSIDLDPASVTTTTHVDRSTTPPQLRVETLLEKSLSFPVAFEDFEDFALEFQVPGGEKHAVDSFGIGRFDPSDEKHDRRKDQLEILHYVSPEDFVVRLVGEESTDRLLLARLSPATTLVGAWEGVESRLAASEVSPLRSGDSFIAPELDFDLLHDFDGMVGQTLTNAGFEGAVLERVRQDLRLRIDEEGMFLRSRVLLGVASAIPSSGPRRMVFDGPFLVAAIEEGASFPYLLGWIGNAELLLPADDAE